jgi:hypothetical protein
MPTLYISVSNNNTYRLLSITIKLLSPPLQPMQIFSKHKLYMHLMLINVTYDFVSNHLQLVEILFKSLNSTGLQKRLVLVPYAEGR